MKPKAKLNSNIDEALVRKLYTVIKENGYCKECLEEENLEYFQKSIIREIEYFHIKYYHMEYISIENSLKLVLDAELKNHLIKSKNYYDVSCKIYDSIQHKLFEFCDIHRDRDKYRDSLYSDKAKRTFIINSLEIVEAELWKARDLELYQDIGKKIKNIKKAILKEEVLSEYIKIMEDCGVNFVCEAKNREFFYPIIVDMYLDYIAIRDNILVNLQEIKKRTKRYSDYMKKVKSGECPIDEIYYYFMKFCKKERVENIKRYVLQFYLDNFNNNKNINTLFRKLHLNTFDNDNRFNPSDMKKYTKKIHNIFVLGANISKFL